MGTDTFFKRIASFATEQTCRTCHGYRLKVEYLSVLVGGRNIGELSSLSVEQSRTFFSELLFTREEKIIVETILKNIVERLEFLA